MANLNIKPNNVLLAPHITEKAVLGADKLNVYVFKVARDANKKSINASFSGAYGVTPVKVRVTTISSGKGKKAYVYLKKGDKIELI